MIQSVKNTFARLSPSAQGAIWMTLSAVFFAAQAGIVRYLSKDLHFIEISFFRAIFGIVIMLPWLMRSGVGVLRTSHTRLYVTRGFLSTVAMYGWFGSLTLIPIGDATAISFTFPLFIALAGVLLLKEPAHVTTPVFPGIRNRRCRVHRAVRFYPPAIRDRYRFRRLFRAARSLDDRGRGGDILLVDLCRTDRVAT